MESHTPNFLYAELDITACAPFFKERRMKCAEPIEIRRKSGIWGAQPSLLVGERSALSTALWFRNGHNVVCCL